MKKIIFAAIAVCSLLAFTTCETLRAMLEEPKVSLHSVEIAKINFTGAEILCKVQVENPNGFMIPFPETGIQLFLNGNSVVQAVLKNENHIGARSTTIVEIPVSFEYLEVFNAVTSLKGRASADYKVALNLRFPTQLIGDLTWDFEYEGNIPLPQLPRLGTPSINFERQGLLSTSVVFSVNIENPNPFDLPSPVITADFQINRTTIVNNRATAEAIRANSTSPVSMRFTVNQADLVRTLAASLLTSASISCNLATSIDFGVPAFGEPLVMQLPGMFPLR